MLEKFKEEVKEELREEMLVGTLKDNELSNVQVWLTGGMAMGSVADRVGGQVSDTITVHARVSLNGEIRKYDKILENSTKQELWLEIGKFVNNQIANDIALTIVDSEGMREFVTAMSKE